MQVARPSRASTSAQVTPLDIGVYLTGNSDTSKEALATFGLVAAYFTVSSDPAVVGVSAVSENPEFDIASIDTPTPGVVSLDLGSIFGTLPAERIYLATLTYTGLGSGSSAIAVTDLGSNTYLNDGGDDPTTSPPTQIFPTSATGQINVTGAVIPEPSSFVALAGLLSTAGLGLLLRRRWSR